MTANTPQPIRAFDIFAGVGGSSCGARMAGVEVVAAVDAWQLARETYLDNFNDVRFYRRKCETLSAPQVLRDVGPVDLIIASPECTSHTCARGNGERSELSRMTAFQVIKFARVLRPRWIVVENVIQMRSWERYEEWLAALRALGYKINEQVLNSADFGVPQSRKRLFIICDLETEPPEVQAPQINVQAARHIINVNGTYEYSPLRTNRRAEATLQRAERALAALGPETPFLLVYYGTDGSGGWQSIDIPLRTITTLDRFAYVRPRQDGQHEMRMLQVPELMKAMGFPDDYKFERGSRRDNIKLLGNAVCPPVMEAIIRTVIRTENR